MNTDPYIDSYMVTMALHALSKIEIDRETGQLWAPDIHRASRACEQCSPRELRLVGELLGRIKRAEMEAEG